MLLTFLFLNLSRFFIQVAIDPKKFIGLHSVADAVEYLHSGKSVGKVFLHNKYIAIFCLVFF